MKKTIIFAGIAVLFALILTAGYFFIGRAPAQKRIDWGIDFSQMQAEVLKLDWKDAYSAIISDLGAKRIKLHTQWDFVEGEENSFFFNDMDWQVKKAEENNVKLIFVLGMKTGRWPECHSPKWLDSMPEAEQKDKLLNYIAKVVQRYKNSPAIAMWQVENEPLFQFGECQQWYYKNDSFLRKEVALVKSLDPSRQVMVSDSGELNWWFNAAAIGDVVGTTMYRQVWINSGFGSGFYGSYHLPPVFYYRKALLIKKIFNKRVECVELQAEPWASKPFYDVPLEEQEKTMNLKIFRDNIKYAKETGLDTFYLWGAEWWYWLKEKQNRPEIWDEAKKIFYN